MSMIHDSRGNAPVMKCADCGRAMATEGPAYPLDSTMSKFRCASCQLAQRVAAVVRAPMRTGDRMR